MKELANRDEYQEHPFIIIHKLQERCQSLNPIDLGRAGLMAIFLYKTTLIIAHNVIRAEV